jgi:hypothetical protein
MTQTGLLLKYMVDAIDGVARNQSPGDICPWLAGAHNLRFMRTFLAIDPSSTVDVLFVCYKTSRPQFVALEGIMQY